MSFGAGALWVLNTVDGVVTRIDPSSGDVTRAITLPPGFGGAALGRTMRATEHGVWLTWVTREGNAVRIDPRSGAARVVHVGPDSVLRTVDFIPRDVSTLWVLAPTRDGVSLLKVNPASPSNVEAETKGLNYGRLALDGDGIWISRPYDPTGKRQFDVARVETRTGRIQEKIPVGAFPAHVAVGAQALWIANWDDGTLSRVDLESREVTATIPVGPNPESLAVTDEAVWVAVRPGAP